jgi:hypothetical protein
MKTNTTKSTSTTELFARAIGQSLWDHHDGLPACLLSGEAGAKSRSISALYAMERIQNAGAYGIMNKIVYCVERPSPSRMIGVCVYDDRGYEFTIRLAESRIANRQSSDPLMAALANVLEFSITCCSGLDDDEFYPKLDKLRQLYRDKFDSASEFSSIVHPLSSDSCMEHDQAAEELLHARIVRLEQQLAEADTRDVANIGYLHEAHTRIAELERDFAKCHKAVGEHDRTVIDTALDQR